MICDKIISDANCNTIVQNEGFNSDYIYIYILQLNKSDGTVCQSFVRTKEEELIKFTIGLDGYYTLCKLKVPLDETMPYYFKNGKFYNNGTREVTLYEILSINPEVSQVLITYYYYFLLCKLRKCYIDIAQKIINNKLSIKCDSNEVNKEDIYKRNLLLSAINVINYLAETERFEEAERLLERVTGCNGLCDFNKHNSCNCGCGG